MNNFNYKTKKEIIIENAYQDPFLKIEDLAQKADTTSRYVRTILSESNLSLMKLRKNYAKKIENNKYNLNDRLLLNYLMKIPFQSRENVLSTGELLLNNSSDISGISDQIQRFFSYYSYKYLVKKKCWGLSTVFLENKYFEVVEDSLSINELLALLNKEISTNNLSISNIEIVVDLSTEQISKLLEMSNLCPILRIKQKISINSSDVAVIVAYFNARNISFSFSYKGDFSINRKGI